MESKQKMCRIKVLSKSTKDIGKIVPEHFTRCSICNEIPNNGPPVPLHEVAADERNVLDALQQ